MEQRISFITIGVEDLEKMKVFYRDTLGWPPIKDSDGIVFFRMNGFIFGLFPADELAEDIGVHHDGQGFKRVTLAINLRSEQEVDNTFKYLREKGVRIVRPPEKVFWGGYRGYFADPEDNYWEIAFNPFLELDNEGNALMHR
jgi:catechol 2,3-dioxygenase-like lactoylglutathione lyase family enzyme